MYLSLAYVFSIVISLLASLSVYFQRKGDSYLRLFPFFLFITLMVECASRFNLMNEDANHAMYNFFSVVEFSFYFFILGEIIKNSRIKHFIKIITGVYALFALAYMVLFHKIYGFPALNLALGCLLIVVICIYYFFELFQLQHSVTLTGQPGFWICSGLLFFYCCSFPLFGPINLVKALPPIILQNLTVIVNLLNVLLYSSFTIAFLCRLRTRNSMS